MNERIQELMEQAAKPENRMNFVTYGKLTNEKLIEFAIQSGVHPSYLDPENPENSLTGSLNKFAELIVRECIRCLQPLSRNHSMVGAAQDTIREHFNLE